MNVTTSSKRWSLNANDFLKGLGMAVLGAIAGLVQGMIMEGHIDIKKIWQAAAIAAISYLAKNFVDKPKVVITDVKDTTIDAVKDGTANVEIQHQ